MIAYTRMSKKELRRERDTLYRDMALAILSTREEQDLDKKEILLDNVLNLAWCDYELFFLLNPNMAKKPRSEMFYRNLCGFPKNNFMNANNGEGKIK